MKGNRLPVRPKQVYVTNPYEILGITKNASEIVVEAAYKALVKEHHPDQDGNQNQFKKIQDAYEKIQEEDYSSSTTNSTSSFSGFASGLAGLATPVSTASIEGTLADDLTIERHPLRVSLVGLFRTDIEPLVWPHTADSIQTESRFLCVTRIENISEYVQKWRGVDKTKFVGSDGQTYSPTLDLASTEGSVPPHIDQRDKFLSPQFSANYTELEPKSWTVGITVAPNLPEEIDIQRVSYSHGTFQGHQTDGHVKERIRYEFSITPEKRQQMLSLIAQELMDEVPTQSPLETVGGAESTATPTQTTAAETKSTQRASGAQEVSTQMTEESLGNNINSESADASVKDELSKQERERVADIVRLAPTSNGTLASSWGLETGKEAWQYLSRHLNGYYKRNENNRIEPTQEAIQVAE